MPVGQESVLLVIRDGAITVATLNRPHRRNALNLELSQALLAFFAEQRRDKESKVIVLRGAGEHFGAGLDLVAVASEGDPTVDDARHGDWAVTDIVRAMRACPQPIIALANGSVVGGSLALALAADMILAGSSSYFSSAFINLGLSGTELGLGWRLQRTIGVSLARELVFTGGRLDAQRAFNAGLVSRVVPDDALYAEGLATAALIATATQDALRLTKRNLDLALQTGSLEAVMELEERAQLRCGGTGLVEAAISDFAKKHAKP